MPSNEGRELFRKSTLLASKIEVLCKDKELIDVLAALNFVQGGICSLIEEELKERSRDDKTVQYVVGIRERAERTISDLLTLLNQEN